MIGFKNMTAYSAILLITVGFVGCESDHYYHNKVTVYVDIENTNVVANTDTVNDNDDANGDGGDGGDGGDDSDNNITKTGVFIDSFVIGMKFSTESQSGKTDDQGQFQYLEGEKIEFSIGDIKLLAIFATEIMTPLSLFQTSDINDIRILNFARLVQSLDLDGNPDNGISIGEQAHLASTGMNIDFSDTLFEQNIEVINLVAGSGSVNTALIPRIDALLHLAESLLDAGVIKPPSDNAPPPT